MYNLKRVSFLMLEEQGRRDIWRLVKCLAYSIVLLSGNVVTWTVIPDYFDRAYDIWKCLLNQTKRSDISMRESPQFIRNLALDQSLASKLGWRLATTWKLIAITNVRQLAIRSPRQLHKRLINAILLFSGSLLPLSYSSCMINNRYQLTLLLDWSLPGQSNCSRSAWKCTRLEHVISW